MKLPRVKGLIVLTSIAPVDSMTSSVKIARFLSAQFKFPIYAYKDHGPEVAADWVLFVNSSTLFSEESYRLFTQRLLRHAKNVIYVQNDYMLPFSTKWKRAAHENNGNVLYWSAIERAVTAKGGSLLDWNRLTYAADAPYSTGTRVDAMFYYGACRQNRVTLFDRWFTHSTAKTPFMISAPTIPQQKKFIALGVQPSRLIVCKDNAVAQLRGFTSTLYLEDPYSSRNYTCLANRFYEALSARSAIAIDARAVKTFERAGLPVQAEWVVDSHAGLSHFLKHAGIIAKLQAKKWRRDFVGELRHDVRRAAKALGML